ncbi:lipase family protein [Gordonia neofelifaecis]|uniref:Secretory lipase n=1 Tax=Gordonia neofelifaecis NRRL B-59395 TaxID=644548 RepID=F1YLD6_9ACTN|nr:lipase family protein [Gordonia neofelifaecis]EGD54596.1 secretory lipase [Gordonia neofelifaecis NRRL B-59395]
MTAARRASAVVAAVAVVASILAASILAAPAHAGPRTRTPALGEVFNGFVIGTFAHGRMAGPDEILEPLRATDPFYREPRLSGTEKPGTLLKSKPVAVQYTGFRPGDVTAYKIMYVTTALDGTADVSTGLIMIPRDGRSDAKRPIVSYQMANDSVGGNCHPSAMWTGADPLDGAAMSALGPLAQLFGKGYAVVMSDVGNNGDPNPHGVFAGKYNARTSLDAIRAAFAVTDAGLSRTAPIGLFGIAGGGVGTGHALEMKDRYAPELQIKAAVLEGMVPNYRNFIATADGSVGSGFAMATLLGLEPHYPDMRLNDHLNDAGRAVADYYRTQCQSPGYFTLPLVPLRTLFKGDQPPAGIASFQRAYRDNVMGLGTPAKGVQTLVASCAADDSPMSLVPAADSRKLVHDWRSRGGLVDYQPTDCSMVEAITDIYGWGTDLFGMQTVDWLAAHLK